MARIGNDILTASFFLVRAIGPEPEPVPGLVGAEALVEQVSLNKINNNPNMKL